MKIQIDNNYFFAKNISIQYTIDDTVDTKISLDSNINKTDLNNILNNKKKFNIKSSNFEIINCFMRYISNSDNNTDLIKKKQSDDEIKLDDFKRDLTLLAPNVDKTSINNKIIEINIRLSDYTKIICIRYSKWSSCFNQFESEIADICKEYNIDNFFKQDVL